ncbi:MAG: T9SS type A sorting domain-containing protein [Saprospiraceae bacterium]|nr:T9SS type A sorting domain-containing protein [Saprospiraceae bacterium]
MITKFRYALLFAAICLPMIMCAQAPSTPQSVKATGYEKHVALNWQANPETNISGYKIYRSSNGGASWEFLKQTGKDPIAVDWTGDEPNNVTRYYRITAFNPAGESAPSVVDSALCVPMTDEQLLEMTQRETFRYFWDYGHPVSGMARERSNGDPNVVTTGGTGFGIMAIVVGAERGWVTRAEAVNRMIQIASFLQFADRFHGVFPHWMNGTNGNVIPFSQYDDGGDLVETAFLMQGLLTARQYFNQDTPLENALRDVITGLWEEVEWDWYRKNNSGVLYWHWSPNFGWQMNFPLRGFYEAQIVYILAAASPTHPVPATLYQTGWTSGNYANNSVHYGYKIYCGPFGGGPMFFAHYSYLGFDPRGKKDAFCNYFVRNRNHALIQQAYSAANPKQHAGYNADCWGLTSCDSPNGYAAHDVWPANDDGTIAPTAALSSMPYTPDASLAALRHFYRVRGERLWGVYGFYDAFNLNQNWYAPSFLAIDQGPIVGMIENYRTGLLWNLFMQNQEIAPALAAIGFVADNTPAFEPKAEWHIEVTTSPNPVTDGLLTVDFQVQETQALSARLRDLQGGVVQELFSAVTFPAGRTQQSWSLKVRSSGVYLLEITNASGQTTVKKVILQ